MKNKFSRKMEAIISEFFSDLTERMGTKYSEIMDDSFWEESDHLLYN